ncbi:Protein of unknown function [Gryllus bimaculatus]|nr:Protein of unknown function [Gryllus bimaculatus]
MSAIDPVSESEGREKTTGGACRAGARGREAAAAGRRKRDLRRRPRGGLLREGLVWFLPRRAAPAPPSPPPPQRSAAPHQAPRRSLLPRTRNGHVPRDSLLRADVISEPAGLRWAADSRQARRGRDSSTSRRGTWPPPAPPRLAPAAAADRACSLAPRRAAAAPPPRRQCLAIVRRARPRRAAHPRPRSAAARAAPPSAAVDRLLVLRAATEIAFSGRFGSASECPAARAECVAPHGKRWARGRDARREPVMREASDAAPRLGGCGRRLDAVSSGGSTVSELRTPAAAAATAGQSGWAGRRGAVAGHAPAARGRPRPAAAAAPPSACCLSTPPPPPPRPLAPAGAPAPRRRSRSGVRFARRPRASAGAAASSAALPRHRRPALPEGGDTRPWACSRLANVINKGHVFMVADKETCSARPFVALGSRLRVSVLSVDCLAPDAYVISFPSLLQLLAKLATNKAGHIFLVSAVRSRKTERSSSDGYRGARCGAVRGMMAGAGGDIRGRGESSEERRRGRALRARGRQEANGCAARLPRNGGAVRPERLSQSLFNFSFARRSPRRANASTGCGAELRRNNQHPLWQPFPDWLEKRSNGNDALLSLCRIDLHAHRSLDSGVQLEDEVLTTSIKSRVWFN